PKHFVLSAVDIFDNCYSLAWKKENLESLRKAGPFDFFNPDICAMNPLRETVARVRPEVILRLAARADCPQGNSAAGRRAADLGRYFKSRKAIRLPAANFVGGRAQEMCGVVSCGGSELHRVGYQP